MSFTVDEHPRGEVFRIGLVDQISEIEWMVESPVRERDASRMVGSVAVVLDGVVDGLIKGTARLLS